MVFPCRKLIQPDVDDRQAASMRKEFPKAPFMVKWKDSSIRADISIINGMEQICGLPISKKQISLLKVNIEKAGAKLKYKDLHPRFSW